jgi:hypothetical protein
MKYTMAALAAAGVWEVARRRPAHNVAVLADVEIAMVVLP